jgi:hypothetical protein
VRVRRVRMRDEQGATLAIVAFSLLVLLGTAAVVVDLGYLLVARRQIVQAVDSAAHAAALSCGLGYGQGDADATSVTYAVANAPGAQLADGYPYYEPSCEASFGRVTVEFTSTEPHFFSQILGAGPTGEVGWRATGLWGAAAGGAGIMPFMLSSGQLTNCEIPPPDPEAAIGEQCQFAFNNQDIGNAQWGGMNLNQWNVAANAGCSSAGTEQSRDWIEGSSAPLVTTNYPDPTYVCRDTGMAVPVWQELGELVGETRMFPVSDPTGVTGPGHGQVDQNGNLCPPPCSPHKYDIVGFAELEIVSVTRGNQGGAELCPGLPSDPNSWCLVTEWVGYSTYPGEEPVDAPNFGVIAVRLDA